jgi:Lipocalin-like domain
MRKLALAVIAVAIPYQATADDTDITGMYRLVSEQRKIVDTGEIVAGSGSQGFISYDKSGRMLVVLVRSPRPNPENLDKMTDQDRLGLFRTMTAYSGMYKFDGRTVEHSIDISWNEYWTGTKQVRTVERDGDRITLTTPPFPFHTDGKMSVNMLVWERVK